MDFRHLIDIYGQPIKIAETSSGNFVGGKYVEGAESTKTIDGIFLKVNFKDFRNTPEGFIEINDMKLIIKEEDGLNIDDLNSEDEKAYILDSSDNKVYKLSSYNDLTGFAKVKKYIAKRLVDNE